MRSCFRTSSIAARAPMRANTMTAKMKWTKCDEWFNFNLAGSFSAGPMLGIAVAVAVEVFSSTALAPTPAGVGMELR